MRRLKKQPEQWLYASLQPALKSGRRTVNRGLERLEPARIDAARLIIQRLEKVSGESIGR
jgi:hypothetical protein